jgi:TonB family protein
MLVQATRTVSALSLRAVMYVTLFLVVAIAQVAIVTALRNSGWKAGSALAVSGVVVLAIVLSALWLNGAVARYRAAWLERQRVTQGLPDGPCCLVMKSGANSGENDMPWEVIGPLRARYPKLARQLGVEGYALVGFEVSADGSAKNVHCIDAWPNDTFFDAATEALAHARFQHRPDQHPRFGASFRMPFVFRISGAARVKERGRRARTLRPGLVAAQQAVEKLRGNA